MVCKFAASRLGQLPMKSYLLLFAIFLLLPSGRLQGQADSADNETVTIGNLDGNEVIVHVYKKKDDPFPFIEFSVVVNDLNGQQTVEITQVEGKTADGGFMIITGVTPASDVGVTRSDRYEISFSKVSDYKIYEKAVMDYLRRLPIPEIELTLDIDETMDAVVIPFEDEDDRSGQSVDLGDIVMDALLEIEDADQFKEISGELLPMDDLEPLDVFTLADTNSAVVHVHRDDNDIDPFKEFVVTLYRDPVTHRKKAKVVEVQGVKSGTRFIIMTGFEDKGEEGIVQAFTYDVNTYNVEDSDVHEAAVIEFMKGLTTSEFDGSVETIKDGWQKALEPEEVVVKKPAVIAPSGKRRKGRQKEMSQRDINKIAKEVEKSKTQAPKYKSKYGKYKSGKMSSRMARYHKKKTSCPSIRGH